MYLRAGGFEQKTARLVEVHVRKKLLIIKVNKNKSNFSKEKEHLTKIAEHWFK